MIKINGQNNYFCNGQGKIFSNKSGSIKELKAGLTKGGYNIVVFSNDGKTKSINVHSIIATQYIGEPDGMHVNHKNGIKTDNRIENLEYVTPKENTQHAARIGLISKRPYLDYRNKASKLDELKVLTAMTYLGVGHSNRSVAKIMGVSHRTIAIIKAEKKVGLSFFE